MSKTDIIGVRPIRMTVLQQTMIAGFMYEYQTRIFPHQKTAILIPVTNADKDRGGLVRIGSTNVYQKEES